MSQRRTSQTGTEGKSDSMDATPPNDADRKSATYLRKREKAIAAATRVFAEKGYHAATTKDIADVLGIRQGSLYYYFSSKEEALEEVCILAMRNYVGRMEQITQSDLPFAEKIHQVVLSHLNSYRDDNEALKVHNDHRLYLPPERRERIKQDGSRYRKMLEQLFQREVAAGRLPEDTDSHFAAHSVIGLCNSWGALIIRDPELDIQALSERCTRLILQGVSLP
ncbi:MAG TPA: TetR/AcrR family transcriptional regulator, partial [Porticoccaceae bacterium]